MGEKTLNENPIATALVTKLKRGHSKKLANLAKQLVHDQQNEEVQAALSSLDPRHSTYLRVQNSLGSIIGLIIDMKEMKPLADIMSQAEEIYMPEGPPMSPLTMSYFNSWALYDTSVNPESETIGSVALALAEAAGMDAESIRLAGVILQSRMGLYVHKGVERELAVLEEMVTGNVCRTHVPAGYSGKKGELWFVRVLPPPQPDVAEHLAFITPYIIRKTPASEWLAYFARTLPQPQSTGDYERHMKYGPSRNYWSEYIFEAYSDYRREAVFLEGIPDIPASLPHSEVNGPV